MDQQDIIRFLSGLKIRLVEMNRLTMILVVFGLGVGSVLTFNMVSNRGQDSIEEQIRILEARINSLPNSSGVASRITSSSSSQSQALERLKQEIRQETNDRERDQYFRDLNKEQDQKLEQQTRERDQYFRDLNKERDQRW
jgi:hypothetical protein